MITEQQTIEVRKYIKENVFDFAFYKNKKSIKIQFPNYYTSSVIKFLESQNIQYTQNSPNVVIKNFVMYEDWDEIRIKR